MYLFKKIVKMKKILLAFLFFGFALQSQSQKLAPVKWAYQAVNTGDKKYNVIISNNIIEMQNTQPEKPAVSLRPPTSITRASISGTASSIQSKGKFGIYTTNLLTRKLRIPFRIIGRNVKDTLEKTPLHYLCDDMNSNTPKVVLLLKYTFK